MGKRFRLRISRIIFCCLNNNNNNNNSVSITNKSFSRSSPASPTVNPHRGSAIKRHVSSALGSCGSTAGSRPPISSCDESFGRASEITELPRRKIYNSSADENDVAFELAFPPPRGKPRKRKKKKRRRASVRVSTSSLQSALFSDDDDETETLVSSTDGSSSYGVETAAKRRVSAGKVGESFAVVKRSDDPRADFKRSMAEMILEKQMFEDEDLEQLLHCYLSLNSRSHHGDIVRAFVEIWEVLFSASSRNGSARSSRRLSLAM